jgi:hypothetical protein
MKPKWLNRTLVLGPHLTLCLSEAEYLAAIKHVGWSDSGEGWCTESGGRTHMCFEHKPVAIVCVDPGEEYRGNRTAIAGFMAHEATHIWQEWCRSMDEDAPGDEIEAYAVQNLVVLLLDEYERRTIG